MELLRRIYHQNIVAFGLALFFFMPVIAYAQTSTPECVWENWNCTPTPEPTPTGTIVPTATPTLYAVDFQPLTFDVPTSIPPIALPTVPGPSQFTPIPAPSPLSIEITPIPTPNFSDLPITVTPAISISAISTSFNISYTSLLSLNLSISGTTGLSETDEISSSVGSWIGDVVSYTGWLTGQVATMQSTGTITVVSAPDWYAPKMPRPMADVGWTFELLTNPDGDAPAFSLSSWASFFGYVVSLPFQFVKSLWQLVAYFGPFGLFLGWLLIMFVIVLAIHAQVFLVKFIFVIIRLVVRILELLGEWVPTGG